MGRLWGEFRGATCQKVAPPPFQSVTRDSDIFADGIDGLTLQESQYGFHFFRARKTVSRMARGHISCHCRLSVARGSDLQIMFSAKKNKDS